MNITSKCIGERMRQQIADTPGMTLSRAAAEIGVHRITLGNQLDSGSIRLGDFLALADVLGTEPSEYMDEHWHRRHAA